MKRSIYLLPLVIIIFSFISPDTGYRTTTGTPVPSGKWVVDKSQSAVRFSVTHLVVSKAEGFFKTFDATMESARPDFSDARIRFTIDAASIDTDNETRDKHLRDEGYFNVEKYPKITFESTSLKPSGGKNYKLTGSLTLKDVTKTVVFDVVYGGSSATDKGAKAVFNCTTVINRYDYNIKSGGAAIGNEVTITVKVEMDEVKGS